MAPEIDDKKTASASGLREFAGWAVAIFGILVTVIGWVSSYSRAAAANDNAHVEIVGLQAQVEELKTKVSAASSQISALDGKFTQYLSDQQQQQRYKEGTK